MSSSALVKIAHLSDPHFGTVKPGVPDALTRVLHALDPHLIIFSGDITQRARAAEFRAAKEFVARFPSASIIAIPGNHDIPLFNLWGRMFHPYRGFHEIFKKQTEKDFVYRGVTVTGLNSTSRWRHIQGDFNIGRIWKRLQDPYTESGTRVRIATFHHPMDCAKGVDEKNLLRGREETMKLLEKANVDLILSGHIHDPYTALSRDRYPHINKSIIISVAGTCLSTRTRKQAPNSFNWIEVEPELSTGAEISVTRYDLDDKMEFSTKVRYGFRRMAANGWARHF
jgi:3',5'-cyclic AMP phosphodiesterase CpdA